MMKSRICVIGSSNVDLTFRTQRFPKGGETLTGRSLHQGMGGKGANQAVAAARLGAGVTFVACVGNDSFGIDAIRHYKADGINTDFIRQVNNHSTGTAAIVVDDQAENCIIVVPGANASLSSSDVRNAAKAIQESDAVVCQLETPLDATLEAFRIGRAAGKLTVLTPAPVIALPDELLGLCDICIPNQGEIEVLVGRSVNSQQDALDAAKLLMSRGVKTVAITMGEVGAFIVDRSGALQIPALIVDAVDTTGAGDAFAAALAVSLCEGQSLREAAHRASVVAALTVTRIGTHAAFPQLAEVDAFMVDQNDG